MKKDRRYAEVYLKEPGPDPDPNPDPDPDPDPDPKPDPDPEVDYKAEYEKWKGLARKHEKQSKSNADAAKELAELKEKDKSEQQKLADKATLEAKRADEAELRALRYEVAQEKEVPKKLMKFLTGSNQEELEESADELLAALKDEEGDDKSDKNKGRPREKLKPGATPDEEPTTNDPAALAAKIPRD